MNEIPYSLPGMEIRRARPADERAIYDLVVYARLRALQIDWAQLRAALHLTAEDDLPKPADRVAGQMDLYCGLAEQQVVSLWASATGAGTISHLKALIIQDIRSAVESAAALLAGVKQALRTAGRTQIAYVGMEKWLTRTLSRNGFTRTGSVITLQRTDGISSERGNGLASVRPATPTDLAAILTIDERAFPPLWRTDGQTLAGQLSGGPYFQVAELQQQIVAYCYASLVGRHGHLTRLVVDPAWQGHRIGIRMLAECIDFFEDQGVYGITLNTQHDNHRAQRLYRRFGFVPLGQEAEVWSSLL